ncbi:DUF7594 domain-containing protein [Anaerohalosphaera lusitana]|uniref:CBM96 family carbohydrate-binding protein n=1 Tax=Anaerohalosphaera lusitana TaxID=1936003 RepID=UPI00197BA209|nr:DNRLRE domain-containing protein [Anaerohalosphaera lusitana]
MQSVSRYGETITLRLTKETVRGNYFEVLVQGSDGSYSSYDAGEVRTYMGTVDEYPDAMVAGVKLSDGTLKTRIYFDRGYTWFTSGAYVTGTRGGNAESFCLPTMGTVTPGKAGSDIYRFDVGIDCDYRYYSRRGYDVQKCVELVEFSVCQVKAIYMRDALLRPALGRVVIRASQAHCPYDGITGTALLNPFKDEWNYNHSPDTTYDAAALATPAIGGGVAWVGVIGSSVRYSVNGLASDGSFDIVWRHELGHNWSVHDYHAGSPEGSTINCGNAYGRFSGPEVQSILGHRDYKKWALDNVGVYTSIDIPPYAALDVPAKIAVDVGEEHVEVIDVLANDFDANGDTLSILSCDSTSNAGRSVGISSGTGPGGCDEILYTVTPSDGLAEFDYFRYEVEDSSGQRATGVVLLQLGYEMPPVWTVESDADTFVRSSDSTNFGDRDYITIKRTNSGASSTYTRTGWVHFDISDKDLTSKAKLSFTCFGGDASNETVTVWGIKDGRPGDELGTDWTEMGLTGNNASLVPDFAEDEDTTKIGSFKSSTVVGTEFTVAGAELAEFLEADTNGEVTFLLVKQPSERTLNICSAENGSGAPTLSAVPMLPADAHVRDGSYAENNFGFDDTMTVKHDGESYERHMYLRFDYNGQVDGAVENAELVLTPTATVSGVMLRVRLVDDSGDDWDEGGITWNDRSVGSGLEVRFWSNYLVKNQSYTLNVTSLVNQAMNANKVATFHIDSLTAGSSYWLDFASKENVNESYRPKLIVRSRTKADVNIDGAVDFEDFALFSGNWLMQDCGLCGGADMDGDADVDMDDLMMFAADWLD